LYARVCGTQQRRFSPITISCTHSRQPAITRLSAKVEGLPRATELSNILPSLDQPVYSTVTMSVAAGCSVLLPGRSTLEMRPVALFVASAGGAVRSGGAARSLACARAGRGFHSAATARAIATTGRIGVGIRNTLPPARRAGN
jgi:hypothetical protein